MPLNDYLFFLEFSSVLIDLVPFPSQILHFLRIDLSVASRPVLLVVLADDSVARFLTHPVTTVRKALTNGKFGLVNIAKDFLSPDDSSAKIVARGTNSYRRKCDVMFLDTLPNDVVSNLKSSKLFSFTAPNMYVCTYVCF